MPTTQSLFALKKPKCGTTTVTTSFDKVLFKHKAALSTALPTISHQTTYHYATGGLWSTHDLVAHIIDTTGPVNLLGCSWSMSSPACSHILNMLADGTLLSMSFLFDWRVSVRCPEALVLARHNSTDIRLTSCHAKVALLHNTDWYVSIVGSANFTNNPRIEAGVIDTSQSAHAFHTQWISAEMSGCKPFGVDMRKIGNKDGRT